MTRTVARAAMCALALALLAGCASEEELRQADASTCQRYGFAPGTAAFANCLQQQNLARNAGGVYPSVGLGVGTGFGGGAIGGAGIGFGF